jgi:serine protease Do
MLLAFSPTLPALAQRAPDSIQIPYGRAPLTFADIVDRVKGSVVSISVSSGGAPRVAQNDKGGGNNAPNRRGQNDRAFPPIPGLPDEFNDFFRNLPKGIPNPTPRPTQAQGSGFVISEDGYVVTNNHVVDGANKITVSFDAHNKFDAELIGTDQRTDVALIKIKSDRKFPAVKLATKPPRVGDWVLAVGNPFGLGGTVTAGIVSALSREIGSGPYDYIQIDAAVNRGNSGGPSFNLDGEVIGINTAIYSPSGGSVGIAFAIPAETVVKVVDQLRKSGSVARGWLGVQIQSLDEDLAKSFGLPDTNGALIREVVASGPGQAAGLKADDVILKVNGTVIRDSRELAQKIGEYQPNEAVDVLVMRGDRQQTIKVTLGRFPSNPDEIARTDEAKPAPQSFGSLGLSFNRSRGSSRDGAEVADVESGSDAASKGLSAGDVVTQVNGEPVASAEDVEAAVKRAKRDTVRLTVRSNNQTSIVAVRVKKG